MEAGKHENVTFIAGAHHQSQLHESEDTFKNSLQAFQAPCRAEQSQGTDGHVWAPTGFPQTSSRLSCPLDVNKGPRFDAEAAATRK